MEKLLIIRFSAFGDVAMTVPVIDSLARQYPSLSISVLTQKQCAGFFDWLPANVEVMGVNLKDYKGLAGLNRLYKELAQKGYDAVADLHDVLRTKFLKIRFRLSGTKVSVIDKGRKEKRSLIGHGQDQPFLKSTFQRYVEVFNCLGLPVTLDFQRLFSPISTDFTSLASLVGPFVENERMVGIAPFAAHEGKVYPLERMHHVAKMLSGEGVKVFLFGAGEKEKVILDSWQDAGIISVCGKLGGLHDEILLISRLKAMISMDSANMHIASLVGVPVVSVWGATHPKAGFLGWGQSPSNVIQKDLPCRPCSVYGNKPCQYGDFRCLHQIQETEIVEKTISLLGS